MSSTESLNNSQKLLRGTHLFPEWWVVRYPICIIDFLESDLLTVSSFTITIATNLSIFSQIFNADKFSADLVVELVLLPTSAFLAMSLKLTSSWLIWLWLFWALRWVIWLTYLSARWNINRNWQNCLNFVVLHSSPFSNTLKIDTSEGPVAQIPLFLTRNYYGG